MFFTVRKNSSVHYFTKKWWA